MPKHVLKTWMNELPLVMQATVLTGIRGPDQVRDDNIKAVIRHIRRCVINNGRNGGKFVRVDPMPDVIEFGQSMEYVSMHFVSHLSHALQILAYKHPSKQIRDMTFPYYERLCQKLHCRPETEQEMDKRLRDDEVVEESVFY